jgi:hypothetical protein
MDNGIGAPGGAGGLRRFTANDVAEVEFTEELQTQPAFPPVISIRLVGSPGDDDGPVASPPENTPLSSRLCWQTDHGFNYFPAGYGATTGYWCRGRMFVRGMRRLRRMANNRRVCTRCFATWRFCSGGAHGAASHKRADFGIIYPMGCYPQELLERADISLVSAAVMRIERLGDSALLSSELVDPQYQPVEQLLRSALGCGSRGPIQR